MIYFVWFANQFLILIVIINFLIAVISQSYENVMDTAVVIKYSQRCDLNSQVSLIYEHSHVLKDNYDCVILSSNTFHGGDDEWSGFCQSVKGYVKEQNAKIFNSIQLANDQLAASKDKLVKDADGSRLIIKKQVNEVKDLLDSLKDRVMNDDQFAGNEVQESFIEQDE